MVVVLSLEKEWYAYLLAIRGVPIELLLQYLSVHIESASPQGIVGELYPVRPMRRLNRLKRPVLIPLIPPAFTLRVPPLARAFVLLGKLSILVILEVPLARLLELTPLEVLASLRSGS